MGVTVVVARLAGASVLGTIAFATSYVSIFTIFLDLGQGVAHIKLISGGENEADCIATYSRITIVLTAVFFIIVLSFFLIQKYLLNFRFESIIHEYVIIITLIAVSLNNIYNIAKTTFNARIEQAKADVPVLIKNIVYQILRLIVVILGFKAIAIALSNLAATLLIGPVIYLLFKNVEIGKFDKSLFKKYVFIALPVYFMNVVDILFGYSDKIILQYLTNSEEVGYYSAGFALGGFILMMGNSFGLLLMPTFSKSIVENNYTQINIIIYKYERYILCFLLPVTIAVAISSELIVNLSLGKSFVNTIKILELIAISSFFYTYFAVYENFISGKGEFKKNALFYSVKFAVFIVLAFLLVSPDLFNMKGKGLAFALLISTIFIGIIFIGYIFFTDKDVKVLPNKKLILNSAIITTIAYIFYPVNQVIIVKISYVLGYLVLFYAVSVLFKVINKQDFKNLIDIFDIIKMKKYISKEINFKE